MSAGPTLILDSTPLLGAGTRVLGPYQGLGVPISAISATGSDGTSAFYAMIEAGDDLTAEARIVVEAQGTHGIFAPDNKCGGTYQGDGTYDSITLGFYFKGPYLGNAAQYFGTPPVGGATVTGMTANPSSGTVAGGSVTNIAITVTGDNSPSQAYTSAKVSGAGSVAGGAITMPVAISSQQQGVFRFTSTQDANYHVDVVLTVAASVPDDGSTDQFATHIFEKFLFPGGVAQANLAGMHWYVFSAVGSEAFGAPLAQGLLETTDGDGYSLIDITGQAVIVPGGLATLAFTNANGDPEQTDLISWFGTVRAL